MNEFEIINSYFKQPFVDFLKFQQQKSRFLPKINLGIGDDCAIFESSDEYEILSSVDNFIESVHFKPNLEPDLIAYKALVRSLSDLMAMGAKPLGFSLSLITNKTDKNWFEKLSKGLVECARDYQIPLIGGDLSRICGNQTNNQSILSIQVFGFTLKNKSLKRSSLKPQDMIFVTGNIGFSGYVLALMKQNKWIDKQLLNCFQKPKIPLNFAGKIVNFANAGIDISDGLFQDMNHLVKNSHCGILVDLEKIEKELLHPKVQAEVKDLTEKEKINPLIKRANQGEDYQLIFSCNKKNRNQIEKIAKNTNTKITCIAEALKAEKLKIKYKDLEIELNNNQIKAYQHF